MELVERDRGGEGGGDDAELSEGKRGSIVLDHIILTLSDVERSLKFYAAALMPLKIKMFMPYKGADGHPYLKESGSYFTA